MEVTRVTKTARNRIDAIFTGSKMFFLNPGFGLVAIADRHDTANNVWDKKFIHYWKIGRSEQIGKDMDHQEVLFTIQFLLLKGLSPIRVHKRGRQASTRFTLYR